MNRSPKNRDQESKHNRTDVANALNKERHEENLKSKFEYGMDQGGGIAARAKPVTKDEINKCLN